MKLTMHWEGKLLQTVKVGSYEHASSVFSLHRDSFKHRASQMLNRCGVIVERGRVVAHVSYNGKVWPGKPENWASTLNPLYDPSEKSITTHDKDSDCAVDPATDLCTICGVLHGDPCPACGGRGFHVDGCEREGFVSSKYHAAASDDSGLPPDPEGTNEESAAQARDTLHHYEETHGEAPYGGITIEQLRDLHRQNIVDLIANLGHYCDREGLDMQDIIDSARGHYDAETDNQGVQFVTVTDGLDNNQTTNAADLREASAGFTCTACGRPEFECSANPCAAVVRDREGRNR